MPATLTKEQQLIDLIDKQSGRSPQEAIAWAKAKIQKHGLTEEWQTLIEMRQKELCQQP